MQTKVTNREDGNAALPMPSQDRNGDEIQHWNLKLSCLFEFTIYQIKTLVFNFKFFLGLLFYMFYNM